MRRFRITFLLCILFCYTFLVGQNNDPVWDIGTKWTYEFQAKPYPSSEISFVINEIIDTVTIDSLKLYKVASYPEYTGISYFHYKDGKVYNYNVSNGILQLLYDFNNSIGYSTDYRPICDPSFDYDSFISKSYYIEIDSIKSYVLPDGTSSTIQYTDYEDPRRILSNVGFLEGYIHYTHDWELGMYICDEFANYVLDLRCFENDSVSYNFKDYPCDTTWMLSSVVDTKKEPSLIFFPNPASGQIQLRDFNVELEFEIFDTNGSMVQYGKCNNGVIELLHEGLNIIKIRTRGDNWEYHKIFNLAISG